MKRASLALLGLAGTAMLSCGSPVMDRDRADRGDGGVVSVVVHVTHGDLGTIGAPNPYNSNAVTYGVDVEVRDGNPGGGTVIEGFDGWVTLSITPGVIVEIDSANGTQVAGRNIHLVNGRGSANVVFRRAYGEMRVWAEEAGYVPADPNSPTAPACANGEDDDGDGRRDFPADYGCAAPNDDSEVGGSYAMGSSEAIYFGSPTIYNVQGGSTSSQLVNERVGITAGTLIVTRISVSGFWVTDIADRSCPDPANPGDPSRNIPCYNSLFAFNFSLPNGIRPCDQLEMLQGSVQEFVGTTQLAQPAWRLPTSGLWIPSRSGACRIPDAVPITATMLGSAQALLEPYESGIVRATGLAFPTLIGPARPCTTVAGVTTCHFAAGASNCDLNGDSKVDYNDPAESTCGNQCQLLHGCSEWTGWRRFGTLQVDFQDGTTPATRIEISPREAIPDLDPQVPPATDPAGFTVTGTLKQVGPNWIIEPRCTQDV
ncbi:MAG: hypothetical protein WCJ30_14370, partial [Deltaproteobacteria bacterium]